MPEGQNTRDVRHGDIKGQKNGLKSEKREKEIKPEISAQDEKGLPLEVPTTDEEWVKAADTLRNQAEALKGKYLKEFLAGKQDEAILGFTSELAGVKSMWTEFLRRADDVYGRENLERINGRWSLDVQIYSLDNRVKDLQMMQESERYKKQVEAKMKEQEEGLRMTTESREQERARKEYENWIGNAQKMNELSEKIEELQRQLGQESDENQISVLTKEMNGMKIERAVVKQQLDDYDCLRASPEKQGNEPSEREEVLAQIKAEINEENENFASLARDAEMLTDEEIAVVDQSSKEVTWLKSGFVSLSPEKIQEHIDILEETLSQIGVHETIMKNRAEVSTNQELQFFLKNSSDRMSVLRLKLEAKLKERQEELRFHNEARDLPYTGEVLEEVALEVEELKKPKKIGEEVGAELEASLQVRRELAKTEKLEREVKPELVETVSRINKRAALLAENGLTIENLTSGSMWKTMTEKAKLWNAIRKNLSPEEKKLLGKDASTFVQNHLADLAKVSALHDRAIRLDLKKRFLRADLPELRRAVQKEDKEFREKSNKEALRSGKRVGEDVEADDSEHHARIFKVKKRPENQA